MPAISLGDDFLHGPYSQSRVIQSCDKQVAFGKNISAADRFPVLIDAEMRLKKVLLGPVEIPKPEGVLIRCPNTKRGVCGVLVVCKNPLSHPLASSRVSYRELVLKQSKLVQPI